MKIHVDIDEPYTATRIIQAFESAGFSHSQDALDADIHYAEYERINWPLIMRSRPSGNSPIVCSYCIRKGLIRKSQNSLILDMYMRKRPASYLRVPLTVLFELDCLDYIDEAMNEAFEIRDGLERNQRILDGVESGDLQVFLMKPSLCNRASGLFLFRSQREFDDILESIYMSSTSDSDNVDSGDESGDASDSGNDTRERLGDIKEWVIQEFIDRPLLSINSRKFHIRTYALAISSMDVYVFDQMLALFALKPYQHLSADIDVEFDPLVHITNTCIQSSHPDFVESESVRQFWSLGAGFVNSDSESPSAMPVDDYLRGKMHAFKQICRIVHDLFDAVLHSPTHFQPIERAFEIYGLDFVVDDEWNVFFLEANAYPDFKQSGELSSSVIDNLFAETAVLVREYFWQAIGAREFQTAPSQLGTGRFVQCYACKSPESVPFGDDLEREEEGGGR